MARERRAQTGFTNTDFNGGQSCIRLGDPCLQFIAVCYGLIQPLRTGEPRLLQLFIPFYLAFSKHQLRRQRFATGEQAIPVRQEQISV